MSNSAVSREFNGDGWHIPSLCFAVYMLAKLGADLDQCHQLGRELGLTEEATQNEIELALDSDEPESEEQLER